ncbi:MAG: hypothetical protein AB8G23_08630 [Myxococcota bacterium]
MKTSVQQRRACTNVARLLLLSLFLFPAACNGPLPFLSGGELSGIERAAPGIWALDEDFAVAQLETQPDAPYSVNIAYTQIGGQLYLNAGDTETNWVKHIAADARIRLRIGETVYAGRAERVMDPSEIAAFGEAWVAESSFHRDPEELDVVWIYRVMPR